MAEELAYSVHAWKLRQREHTSSSFIAHAFKNSVHPPAIHRVIVIAIIAATARCWLHWEVVCRRKAPVAVVEWKRPTPAGTIRIGRTPPQVGKAHARRCPP